MAEAEGRLPPLPDGVTLPVGQTKRFDPEDLDEYWANNLNFSLLEGPDPKCIETFEMMKDKLNIVAFSNGPRKYVSRVLQEIGLLPYFPPKKLFAVNDVLPYCKPDLDSFHLVFEKVGVTAPECIMVEDSMKNIRVAKSLGMKTILVVGKGRKQANRNNDAQQGADDAEATKAGDAPDETDPAVDGKNRCVCLFTYILNQLSYVVRLSTAVVEVASEVDIVLKKWRLL